MYNLYKQDKGVLKLIQQYLTIQGILGDEMGLGKTVQTISFLLAITFHNR